MVLGDMLDKIMQNSMATVTSSADEAEHGDEEKSSSELGEQMADSLSSKYLYNNKFILNEDQGIICPAKLA